MDNWISYVFVIFVTALITAIITENAIIARLQLSDGVGLIAGKCRMKPGYGKLDNSQETTGPTGPGNQQSILLNIQNDVQFIKNKLNS